MRGIQRIVTYIWKSKIGSSVTFCRYLYFFLLINISKISKEQLTGFACCKNQFIAKQNIIRLTSCQRPSQPLLQIYQNKLFNFNFVVKQILKQE